MRETAVVIGYTVMVAVPALVILLLLAYNRTFRPFRRAVCYVAHKLDRGLRLFFELFFGPMETWRLYRWLRRNEPPDPSIGRGSLSGDA